MNKVANFVTKFSLITRINHSILSPLILKTFDIVVTNDVDMVEIKGNSLYINSNELDKMIYKGTLNSELIAFVEFELMLYMHKALNLQEEFNDYTKEFIKRVNRLKDELAEYVNKKMESTVQIDRSEFDTRIIANICTLKKDVRSTIMSADSPKMNAFLSKVCELYSNRVDYDLFEFGDYDSIDSAIKRLLDFNGLSLIEIHSNIIKVLNLLSLEYDNGLTFDNCHHYVVKYVNRIYEIADIEHIDIEYRIDLLKNVIRSKTGREVIDRKIMLIMITDDRFHRFLKRAIEYIL